MSKSKKRSHKKPSHSGPFVFPGDSGRFMIPDERLRDGQEEPQEGICGENVRWRLEITPDAAVLHLTGSGSMYPYTDSRDNPPWYQNADLITEIRMDDGITHLGAYCFSECWDLTAARLPAQLRSIRRGAFAGCRALTLTALPDTLTRIESGAFDGCGKLALTTLPDSLVCIEDGAFRGCSRLVLDYLPDSLEYIGQEAFLDCPGLKLSQLPPKLSYMGRDAFTGCPLALFP